MVRRLLLVGLLAYVVATLSKVFRQGASLPQPDPDAVATWDSEGGTPAPDPVDAIVTT